jgi:hypothetical protein
MRQKLARRDSHVDQNRWVSRWLVVFMRYWDVRPKTCEIAVMKVFVTLKHKIGRANNTDRSNQVLLNSYADSEQVNVHAPGRKYKEAANLRHNSL